MRRSGSSVRESSSRLMISVSTTAAEETVEAEVSPKGSRWFVLVVREREDVDGGEPCGRVNIVRNQADVILSVVEGTRKSTPSREPSTTSASKENNGWNLGPLGSAGSEDGAVSACMMI